MTGNFTFFLRSTLNFVVQMLPSALAAAVVFGMLRPFRIQQLIARGLRSSLARETALFLFLAFVAGLAALTLTPRGFWDSLFQGEIPVWPKPFTGRINWIPQGLGQLRAGRWAFFILAGNLVMFVPIGFFPSLLWGGHRWKRALAWGFFSSLFIEVCQLFCARSTDIDDLILNTLGALGGYWLYLLLCRLFPAFMTQFRCERQEVPPWTPNRRSRRSARS